MFHRSLAGNCWLEKRPRLAEPLARKGPSAFLKTTDPKQHFFPIKKVNEFQLF